MDDLSQYISQLILNQAKSLKYRVADDAPNSFEDLINQPTMVIWAGESDNTIFNSPQANWAFRALHDTLHLKTGVGFTPQEEMYLGRVQASQYQGIVADLVYSEVAGQAEYYLKNGVFVPDQKAFTLDFLKKNGIKF